MHHASSKWQARDWKVKQTRFPRYTFITVQENSENGVLALKLEHQSKYFTEIAYTLYLICAYFWIDDVNHLSLDETNDLKAECDKHGLPHIYRETHIFISDDMMHDAAAVQHFNAIFTNYVKTKVQQPDHPFTIHFTQSDGCAAQYACATQYLWISKQFSETGIYRDWTFFCSCHGKCICDPEGGACKRKVDHEQLRDSADNPCKIANIDPDLVNFLQSEFVHPTHTTAEKKGKGVFRRHIHYIPGIYACQVYHGMCMLLFWGHVSC
jgi:hypothetical protein